MPSTSHMRCAVRSSTKLPSVAPLINKSVNFDFVLSYKAAIRNEHDSPSEATISEAKRFPTTSQRLACGPRSTGSGAFGRWVWAVLHDVSWLLAVKAASSLQ